MSKNLSSAAVVIGALRIKSDELVELFMLGVFCPELTVSVSPELSSVDLT